MHEPDVSRAQWRKSRHSSANGQCVEVADKVVGGVAVRDSKHPDGPVLVVSRESWRGFLAMVRQDLPV